VLRAAHASLETRLQWKRRSGSTAHLVAPDPATSPLWGVGSVRLTLATEAEHITDPGRVPRRAGAERLRPEPLAGIQPAARTSGLSGTRAGTDAVRDHRAGSRLTVSARAGPSAGRRRRRRDMEVLLVVRRAERDRVLLDGGHGVRSRW
jgi:hypothetical protein